MDPYLLSRISRTLARETESHSRTLARVETCEKSATLFLILGNESQDFLGCPFLTDELMENVKFCWPLTKPNHILKMLCPAPINRNLGK